MLNMLSALEDYKTVYLSSNAGKSLTKFYYNKIFNL
ncbi:hypothetical protein PRO82_001100 [Candidatus Protochlamydia amoebophila]|nr:hypothetical protein [Candidatus Protochlamydia amoebophila]